MEDRSFDELTKKLASPVSRRGLLKAAAASVMGAILIKLDGGQALAVDKKCSDVGGKCNPGHDCCDHLVCNHTGPGANGTCGCPPNTVKTNGQCVCPDTGQAPCSFNADGSAICCNKCQSCDPHSTTCVNLALQPCTTCNPATGAITSTCGACQKCDTTTVPSGTCVNACGACDVCQNGACASTCGLGQACCSGNCTNTSTDVNNCGMCGHPCGANATCVNSTCVALPVCAQAQPCGPVATCQCSTGQACVNNTCVTQCSSPGVCGTYSTHTCPPGAPFFCGVGDNGNDYCFRDTNTCGVTCHSSSDCPPDHVCIFSGCCPGTSATVGTCQVAA